MDRKHTETPRPGVAAITGFAAQASLRAREPPLFIPSPPFEFNPEDANYRGVLTALLFVGQFSLTPTYPFIN